MPFNLPEIDTLSLRSQIAQMIVVRATGFLSDHQIQYPQWEIPIDKLEQLIKEDIGGVILVGGSAPEVYLRTQKLQSLTSQIPLFIAADVEEGVGQRFKGATYFPPNMALQTIFKHDSELAINYAHSQGEITAQEAVAIGINWLLAPVVDVNNNPANPVINVRAYSTDPKEVISLATAFIQGASQYPVLTTAKHFPGHGDTAVDSHLHTPVLAHSGDRFAQIELPPFKAAIDAGVDAVMSAHVFAPNLDAHTISTLSYPTLTGLLQEELGFAGLIVTDALIMAGVSDRYSPEEVAVQAILAGADILLMPIDADQTINAILAAVESGKISKERIKLSLTKIWQAKAKILPSYKSSDNSQNNLQNIARPEYLKIATEITTKSIQIYLPPSTEMRSGIEIDTNLIFVDNILTCGDFLREHSEQAISDKSFRRIIVDTQSIEAFNLDKISKHIFVQIFSRGNPFRGSAGMYEQIENLIKELVNLNKLEVIALYGSPYNLERLLPLLNSDIAWAFSYSQQAIAQTEVRLRLGYGG